MNSTVESDTENTDSEPITKHPRIDSHATESDSTSELSFSGSSTSAMKTKNTNKIWGTNLNTKALTGGLGMTRHLAQKECFALCVKSGLIHPREIACIEHGSKPLSRYGKKGD